MNKRNKIIRIIYGLTVIASIIWGFWWMTWALAIIGLFIFDTYYEIIAWGIIYDALYGVSLSQFYSIPIIFSISSIILFLISFFLRKNLLVYE